MDDELVYAKNIINSTFPKSYVAILDTDGVVVTNKQQSGLLVKVNFKGSLYNEKTKEGWKMFVVKRWIRGTRFGVNYTAEEAKGYHYSEIDDAIKKVKTLMFMDKTSGKKKKSV